MTEMIFDVFEGDPPIGDRLAWSVGNHLHARVVPVGTSRGTLHVFEISATGVWVDTRTNLVVTSTPSEGRQLVAAGGPLTPSVLAAIASAEG